MVEIDLEILRRQLPGRVVHVDARWSDSLEEIGSSGWGKFRRLLRYVKEALVAKWRKGAGVLYYVPGPVKWSAVVRDIVVLGILRRVYPSTVFHWHAIGQGEWAHGSERVSLTKSHWLDFLMRKLSAWSLREPDLSIVVSKYSDKDARAIASDAIAVVPNGIDDPADAKDEVPGRPEKPVRLLFFSRGTREKGILDALEVVLACTRRHSWVSGEYTLTLAGGIDPEVEEEVRALSRECAEAGVPVNRLDFVAGKGKREMFQQHDCLLFPSRWESFGLVIAEAMAFDLPVVSAASDGATGVLGRDYPYLAPVGDIDRLADALAWALDSDYEKGANRRRYLNEFDRSAHDRSLVRAVSDFEESIRQALRS
jgi:glycosyltransferase involved in cell wall biosynthesis